MERPTPATLRGGEVEGIKEFEDVEGGKDVVWLGLMAWRPVQRVEGGEEFEGIKEFGELFGRLADWGRAFKFHNWPDALMVDGTLLEGQF